MVGHWILFGIIAFAVLVGTLFMRYYSLMTAKIEITPQIRRHANFVAFKLIAFYWLCDLFYMSCFINNLACKFIFGGLVMIIIFMNLTAAFTFPKDKRNGYEKYGMVQDFVIGVGLSIYLIYIIPDANVKEVVIPVVAAVYGGLITLVGVSWTIKKSDKDRREDEIKKSRPIFSYNMLRKEPTLDYVVQKLCMSDTLEKDIYSCEVFVELENSNLSMFEIKRIHHDNNWVEFEGNTVVLPGAKCLLNFRFSNNPEHIILEVEDLLKIKYYFQLKVLNITGAISSSGKILHTIREIKQISTEEMAKLVREEPING